jgi:hypothetical protein
MLAALATAVASASCFTMKSVTLDELNARPAPRVWVTHSDQSQILVDGPQVFRGKLVGFVGGKYRELPPSDLRELQVRKVAVGRTLAVVGGTLVAAAAVAAIVSGGESHFDPCAGDEDCTEASLTATRGSWGRR